MMLATTFRFRFQVLEERLGPPGAPRRLRRLPRGEPGAPARGRRRHEVHARPPGALLLHQRRAGALRGGAAHGRARGGRARRSDTRPGPVPGGNGRGARSAVRGPPDTCPVQAVRRGVRRVYQRMLPRRVHRVVVYELPPARRR